VEGGNLGVIRSTLNLKCLLSIQGETLTRPCDYTYLIFMMLSDKSYRLIILDAYGLWSSDIG
jgi:hypothetical protein